MNQSNINLRTTVVTIAAVRICQLSRSRPTHFVSLLSLLGLLFALRGVVWSAQLMQIDPIVCTGLSAKSLYNLLELFAHGYEVPRGSSPRSRLIYIPLSLVLRVSSVG